MGLTNQSIGMHTLDSDLVVVKKHPSDKVIALAGNPNVGKSTIFNALTGMNQHTGNWPGKTVSNAQGHCESEKNSYIMVDIPGTYSLMAHSAEEEIARNFICFGEPDAVVVVCDATCLERNMNLVLQTMEISSRVIVCVNLMDEARRKKIRLNLPLLSRRLGVPVIGTSARKKSSLDALLHALDQITSPACETHPARIHYPKTIEHAVRMIEPLIEEKTGGRLNSRWLSLRLLCQDSSLLRELSGCLGNDFLRDPELLRGITLARKQLSRDISSREQWDDAVAGAIVSTAEKLCKDVITYENTSYRKLDFTADRLLTSRMTGFPVMLLMLALIFWITIYGANYPSALLSDGLFFIQDRLTDLFQWLHAPDWLHGLLVLGLYRVLAWVISVMLPPMAIFFPLFNLLEDAGYLPRIAYNLDKPFHCCHACGKQALTMCMGFGCNAAGVTGCRIIDSPRERMLAILTNSFVPCNGRFPALIAVLTMFFAGCGKAAGAGSSALAALLLTTVILGGVAVTLLVTGILSKTLLRGLPSFFTLELPPYRVPQVGSVIVRSVLDRTLFVLARAAAVAAPAGLLIWLLANVNIGSVSVLQHIVSFLEPAGTLLGLDGAVLAAFILGLPANEIVIPIVIMIYLTQGNLSGMENLVTLRALLIENGWTEVTALCFMLFSLMHWPCSTTLLTVYKETGSWKWTGAAALIPTLCGGSLCILVSGASALLFGI